MGRLKETVGEGIEAAGQAARAGQTAVKTSLLGQIPELTTPEAQQLGRYFSELLRGDYGKELSLKLKTDDVFAKYVNTELTKLTKNSLKSSEVLEKILKSRLTENEAGAVFNALFGDLDNLRTSYMVPYSKEIEKLEKELLKTVNLGRTSNPLRSASDSLKDSKQWFEINFNRGQIIPEDNFMNVLRDFCERSDILAVKESDILVGQLFSRFGFLEKIDPILRDAARLQNRFVADMSLIGTSSEQFTRFLGNIDSKEYAATVAKLREGGMLTQDVLRTLTEPGRLIVDEVASVVKSEYGEQAAADFLSRARDPRSQGKSLDSLVLEAVRGKKKTIVNADALLADIETGHATIKANEASAQDIRNAIEAAKQHGAKVDYADVKRLKEFERTIPQSTELLKAKIQQLADATSVNLDKIEGYVEAAHSANLAERVEALRNAFRSTWQSSDAIGFARELSNPNSLRYVTVFQEHAQEVEKATAKKIAKVAEETSGGILAQRPLKLAEKAPGIVKRPIRAAAEKAVELVDYSLQNSLKALRNLAIFATLPYTGMPYLISTKTYKTLTSEGFEEAAGSVGKRLSRMPKVSTGLITLALIFGMEAGSQAVFDTHWLYARVPSLSATGEKKEEISFTQAPAFKFWYGKVKDWVITPVQEFRGHGQKLPKIIPRDQWTSEQQRDYVISSLKVDDETQKLLYKKIKINDQDMMVWQLLYTNLRSFTKGVNMVNPEKTNEMIRYLANLKSESIDAINQKLLTNGFIYPYWENAGRVPGYNENHFKFFSNYGLSERINNGNPIPLTSEESNNLRNGLVRALAAESEKYAKKAEADKTDDKSNVAAASFASPVTFGVLLSKGDPVAYGFVRAHPEFFNAEIVALAQSGTIPPTVTTQNANALSQVVSIEWINHPVRQEVGSWLDKTLLALPSADRVKLLNAIQKEHSVDYSKFVSNYSAGTLSPEIKKYFDAAKVVQPPAVDGTKEGASDSGAENTHIGSKPADKAVGPTTSNNKNKKGR
ncbi:MAG: hypothetical protein Q7S22_06700 [Candidatus Micrarchaeota archaeon]|nr:hypothetical protein [Candidatus Micrarchaeota archaeon]